MHSFRNILYASTGIGDDIEGLKQALSLARANRAALKCLLVYPELPKSHEMYQDRYREFLLEQMDTAIRQARAALHLRGNDPPVTVELDAGADPPAVRMIRHALREVHDLVIKEAEPIEGGVGFTSLDMTLLRKCPCPVWLARPINRPKSEIRVAVAVSADNREASEHDLALRLLTLGRSLADSCDGDLPLSAAGISSSNGSCAATPGWRSRPTPCRAPCRTPSPRISWNSAGCSRRPPSAAASTCTA